MTELERRVRAFVMRHVYDMARGPQPRDIAAALGTTEQAAVETLQALATDHVLVLRPGTHAIWMASPFSAVPSDFVVRIGPRQWFANCVWDGLSILALLGDGELHTHSPATGAPIVLAVSGGSVSGDALVHFLVPARRFWDDIGFT
jgi:Alkylmercury lyase